MSNKITMDTLIQALSLKLPTVKVGVLASKNLRKDADSNASIGIKHEFGLDGMPQRSFIRAPIVEFMQPYLEQKNAFSKKSLENALKEDGTLNSLFGKIGALAVSISMDAFDSGGFGTWSEHAPGYENNTGQILVDTTQLRDSVMFEVVP